MTEGILMGLNVRTGRNAWGDTMHHAAKIDAFMCDGEVFQLAKGPKMVSSPEQNSPRATAPKAAMRFEKSQSLLLLTLEMQGSAAGVTLQDSPPTIILAG